MHPVNQKLQGLQAILLRQAYQRYQGCLVSLESQQHQVYR